MKRTRSFDTHIKLVSSTWLDFAVDIRVFSSQLTAVCAVSAGSIISKKGAESLFALVLDVKFGRAAICKDLESATELAQMLVSTTTIQIFHHKRGREGCETSVQGAMQQHNIEPQGR